MAADQQPAQAVQEKADEIREKGDQQRSDSQNQRERRLHFDPIDFPTIHVNRHGPDSDGGGIFIHISRRPLNQIIT